MWIVGLYSLPDIKPLGYSPGGGGHAETTSSWNVAELLALGQFPTKDKYGQK